MSWWQRNDVVLYETTECHYCKTQCNEDYVIPVGTHTRHRRVTTYAARVCFYCYLHEAAMLEARDKSCRFTEIDVVDHCVCGRAYVFALQGCYTCAHERRMLGYQAAEIKRCRRILTEIRKEVRAIECG